MRQAELWGDASLIYSYHNPCVCACACAVSFSSLHQCVVLLKPLISFTVTVFVAKPLQDSHSLFMEMNYNSCVPSIPSSVISAVVPCICVDVRSGPIRLPPLPFSFAVPSSGFVTVAKNRFRPRCPSRPLRWWETPLPVEAVLMYSNPQLTELWLKGGRKRILVRDSSFRDFRQWSKKGVRAPLCFGSNWWMRCKNRSGCQRISEALVGASRWIEEKKILSLWGFTCWWSPANRQPWWWNLRPGVETRDGQETSVRVPFYWRMHFLFLPLTL